jgi:hypothetical protein
MAGSIRGILRSAASAVIQIGEDPETLLEHLFADLHLMVSTLDRQHFLSASGLRLLKQHVAALDEQEIDLVRRIEASMEAEDEGEDVVLALGASLEVVQSVREQSQIQLEVFHRSHSLSLDSKRQILSDLQERCREVASYLSAETEAEWRQRVSREVSRLAHAPELPELQAEVETMEAEIRQKEAARLLPDGDGEAVDLAKERKKLRETKAIQRIRERKNAT